MKFRFGAAAQALEIGPVAYGHKQDHRRIEQDRGQRRAEQQQKQRAAKERRMRRMAILRMKRKSGQITFSSSIRYESKRRFKV